MKKNNPFPFASASASLLTGMLCLLLLNSCGKDGQFSSALISNTQDQVSLNPVSKGEQLNPISKGEQLNPISKGERIISGAFSLLGTDQFIPAHTVRFFLDGKPIPSDWLRLSYQDKHTLNYQVTHVPSDNMHILEIRYLDENLSTMIPPEEKTGPAVLNLGLHSSFVVNTIRFADAQEILSFADWTPALFQSLRDHEDLNTLITDFKAENNKQTPTQLDQWGKQSKVQQQLQTILKSLKPEPGF